jgi:hypothetical protein
MNNRRLGVRIIMKRQLSRVYVLLVLFPACLLAFSCSGHDSRHFGTNMGSIPVSKLSGSAISQTEPNVTVRFEAVVVSRETGKCIELFTRDEFKKYDGDPKWTISSRLGFEPGNFNSLRESGDAMVTGKYVFVRGVNDGQCGIVTGRLFEIDEIEYLN